jgi:hypothetical protein
MHTTCRVDKSKNAGGAKKTGVKKNGAENRAVREDLFREGQLALRAR